MPEPNNIQSHQEPPSPQRVLVIMAHPDDVEFVMGGTIAKWIKGGATVSYVLATRGDAGSHEPEMTREKLARIREAEQLAAAQVFGVSDVSFLDYRDGEVEPTLDLRRELVRHIRRIQPDVVACFDPTNVFVNENYVNHPDHRAVGQAALDAVTPAAAMPLNFVELMTEGLMPHRVREIFMASAAQPNVWVDITDTIDLKFEALYKHDSQFNGNHDRIDTMLRTWAADSGQKIDVTYAEQFRRLVLIRED